MKRWLFLSAALILLLSACSLWKRPLDEEIVGKWIDAEGYEVEFHPNGQGFIPGEDGAITIPDTPFSYRVENESKLFLIMADGTTLELEVSIKGDKMTWSSHVEGFDFEYSRVK